MLNVQLCNGGDCLFVCCYEMYRSKLKIMWNKHNSKCERCRRWCAWFYKWVSSEKGVSIIHMQVWNYFLQIYCQFHHVVLIWKANQNFVGYIDFKVKGNMDENKFATEQVQLYSTQNRRPHAKEQRTTSGGYGFLSWGGSVIDAASRRFPKATGCNRLGLVSNCHVWYPP